MNGSFVAAAARIAQEGRYFIKFNLINGTNSEELVEKLKLHQIHLAVLAQTALIEEASSYKITKLFEDHIAWAVPSTVSDREISHTLFYGSAPSESHALGRYVDVTQHSMTRREAKNGIHKIFLTVSLYFLHQASLTQLSWSQMD